MQSAVETLSPTRVRLTVEVPFAELKPELDSAYKKIGQQVRVQGFRPGKVPARILDQRVGRGAVLEEALNDAVPRLYGEAVEQSGVTPVAPPQVEVTKMDDGVELAFTAEVDVRPEITLPAYDGLSVTVDAVEVDRRRGRRAGREPARAVRPAGAGRAGRGRRRLPHPGPRRDRGRRGGAGRHRAGPELPARLRQSCSRASTRRSPGASAGDARTFQTALVGR